MVGGARRETLNYRGENKECDPPDSAPYQQTSRLNALVFCGTRRPDSRAPPRSSCKTPSSWSQTKHPNEPSLSTSRNRCRVLQLGIKLACLPLSHLHNNKSAPPARLGRGTWSGRILSLCEARHYATKNPILKALSGAGPPCLTTQHRTT